MKKLLFILAIASMLIGTAIGADVLLNKKHKGLNGKDGDKVNCVYCHKKAGNPKKTKEYEKYKKGPFCMIEGCH